MDQEIKKTIKVVVLTQNNEMEVASVLYRLKEHFITENRVVDIAVFDNGSEDRTIQLVKEIGIEPLTYDEFLKKIDVVKRSLEIGKKNKKDTLILLDLTGGNDADDAISLIRLSDEEGARFASGYIYPPRKGTSIGCWAVDKGLLGVEVDIGMNIEKTLLDLTSKSDLELMAIRETISSRSKKKKSYLLKMMPRSPLTVITEVIRYHPLILYGSLGVASVLTALGSGFYTIDYFYKYNELSYFPAIITATLIMIGGFFLVAGLMLNALNVLAEKLEAMKKWID